MPDAIEVTASPGGMQCGTIMKSLRRLYIEGGTYFFTVVTHQRQAFLCDPPCRKALREAIRRVRDAYPFDSLAWVLLPDHVHTIWALPENDADYSTRWGLIKRYFSHQLRDVIDMRHLRTARQVSKRESGLWQHRFWEHAIRNEMDLRRHVEYIHNNPVKHGLVSSPDQWEWSTYRMYHEHGCNIEKMRLPDDFTGGE